MFISGNYSEEDGDVAKHASLSLDLDPLHPRSVPECRLLGADSVVAQLKEKFGRNLDQWYVQLG